MNYEFGKNKIIIPAVIIIAFFLLITGTASFVLASSEDLTVTKITRITHPNYRASNLWYGVRDPWNRDYTRLMLYENTGYAGGRGLVWGFVDKLKSWTTLAEYQNAATPFPNNNYWHSLSAYWSPFPGEENIVYGIYTSGKTISKLNVDTGVRTIVASYDPGDGTNVSRARALGWTTDNTLIVNFDNEVWTSGGYEVNVQTGARTRYSSQAGTDRWPQLGHGHGHKSPDKLYNADYASYPGQNIYGVVRRSDNQRFIDDKRFDQIAPVNHVSWRSSNDWFLGSGATWTYGPSAPELKTKGLFQVFFNRTTNQFSYKPLYTFQSPAQWWDGSANAWVENWHTHPLATLRSDGLQIFFTSTDGKYSYEDNQKRGVTPWGFEGFFLADLASASSPSTSDTTPPAAPTGLNVV